MYVPNSEPLHPFPHYHYRFHGHDAIEVSLKDRCSIPLPFLLPLPSLSLSLPLSLPCSFISLLLSVYVLSPLSPPPHLYLSPNVESRYKHEGEDDASGMGRSVVAKKEAKNSRRPRGQATARTRGPHGRRHKTRGHAPAPHQAQDGSLRVPLLAVRASGIRQDVSQAASIGHRPSLRRGRTLAKGKAQREQHVRVKKENSKNSIGACYFTTQRWYVLAKISSD